VREKEHCSNSLGPPLRDSGRQASYRDHSGIAKSEAKLLLQLIVFAPRDPREAERASRSLARRSELVETGPAPLRLVVEDVWQKGNLAADSDQHKNCVLAA
jgi:hypothetical protein